MSSKKSLVGVLENTLSDISKGIGCFEGIPGRRYGLMRTARTSNWWEIHDVQLGRRVNCFKTWETNSAYLNLSYAFPIAVGIDCARLGISIYKDQGIGANVATTCFSSAGGWIGGYFGARGGAVVGEVIGGVFGPSYEGVGSVALGYIAGILGAHYGEKILLAVLPDS